jgi:hypothetical protein
MRWARARSAAFRSTVAERLAGAFRAGFLAAVRFAAFLVAARFPRLPAVFFVFEVLPLRTAMVVPPAVSGHMARAAARVKVCAPDSVARPREP